MTEEIKKLIESVKVYQHPVPLCFDSIARALVEKSDFDRVVEELEYLSELRKPSEDIKQAIEEAAKESSSKLRIYCSRYDYKLGFTKGAEFALNLSENSGQVDEPSSRSQENGAELLEAAKQILDLHVCEMEGLSSGQPTPTEWMNAVDKLSEAISNYEKSK